MAHTHAQEFIAAVETAVRDGKVRASALSDELNATMRQMERAIADLEKATDAKDANSGITELVTALRHDLTTAQTKTQDLFRRQVEALAHFNIVLFGRTGAGKSTLTEVFTGGTGRSVSDGRSDYTTAVSPNLWRGVGRIIDTPGVGGWGRSESRENLEGLARTAAESADVILLAFDSQNQQAYEFGKVAEWVAKYNKPAVALLNVRNARWRRPDKVPSRSARSNLSQQVREHANHIGKNLGDVGLGGTPVIALSAKRALFARADGNYDGPDAESFKSQRKELGVQQLDAWSNFGSLELLITEALRADANRLRLGMLNDQLRGSVGEIATQLQERCHALDVESAATEKLIEGILRIVGYPKELLTNADERSTRRALQQLESLRGSSFEAPAEGEVRRHLSSLASAKLAILQKVSLDRGENAIADAFDRRTTLDSARLHGIVFDSRAIEQAVRETVDQATDYLKGRLQVEANEFISDLKFSLGQVQNVQGDAGVTRSRVGTGVQGLAILTTAGLAIAPFTGGFSALAVAGIAVVGAVVSWIGSWFGSKQRQKAEAERNASRASAIAEVRRVVYATYDELRQKVADDLQRLTTAAVEAKLLPLVQRAVALRQARNQLASAGASAADFVRRLPRRANAAEIFRAAMTRVQQSTTVGAAPSVRGDAIWLGEGWLDDPTGLVRDQDDAQPVRSKAAIPSLMERILMDLDQILSKFGDGIRAGGGRRWIDQATAELNGDPAGLELAALATAAAKREPQVFLVGDYNAGKSSLIKRLFLEAGLNPPKTLSVRADPTTDVVHRYDWEELTLVDCPGFQSENELHTRLALDALHDAALVFYVFPPAMVSGDLTTLRTVLLGDEEAGLMPKLQRTIFVLNRIDELGVDPESSPADFEKLCARRREEMVRALASQGVNVSKDKILAVASDPYALVGKRLDVNSESYAPFRSWDGMASMLKVLRAHKTRIARVSADLSLLEGGIAILAKYRRQLDGELGSAATQARALERLIGCVERLLREADAFRAETRTTLERAVDTATARILHEVIEASTDDALNRKLRQLQSWWEDPAFLAEIAGWAKGVHAREEALVRQIRDELDRQLRSPEFRNAGFNIDAAAPTHGKTGAFGHAAVVTQTVGRGLKAAEKASERFLIGATKAGKVAGAAAKPVAVLGVVLDIADLVVSLRAEAKREEARRKAREYMASTRQEVIKQLLDENDAGGDGSAEAIVSALEKIEKDYTSTQRALEVEQSRYVERGKIYRDLIGRAKLALGISAGEAQ